MYPARVKRHDKEQARGKPRRRARHVVEGALGAIAFRVLKAGFSAMWRGVQAQAGSREVPPHERVIAGVLAAARGRRRLRTRERETSEAHVLEGDGAPGDARALGRISALGVF